MKTKVSKPKLKVDGMEPVLQAFDTEDMAEVEATGGGFQRVFVQGGWLSLHEEQFLCGALAEAFPAEGWPDMALCCLPTSDFRRKQEQEDANTSVAPNVAVSWDYRILPRLKP